MKNNTFKQSLSLDAHEVLTLQLVQDHEKFSKRVHRFFTENTEENIFCFAVEHDNKIHFKERIRRKCFYQSANFKQYIS
jgi:hypothetical protein